MTLFSITSFCCHLFPAMSKYFSSTCHESNLLFLVFRVLPKCSPLLPISFTFSSPQISNFLSPKNWFSSLITRHNMEMWKPGFLRMFWNFFGMMARKHRMDSTLFSPAYDCSKFSRSTHFFYLFMFQDKIHHIKCSGVNLKLLTLNNHLYILIFSDPHFLKQNYPFTFCPYFKT